MDILDHDAGLHIHLHLRVLYINCILVTIAFGSGIDWQPGEVALVGAVFRIEVASCRAGGKGIDEAVDR